MKNTWGMEFGRHSKTSGYRKSLWNFYFEYFIPPVVFMFELPVCMHLLCLT